MTTYPFICAYCGFMIQYSEAQNACPERRDGPHLPDPQPAERVHHPAHYNDGQIEHVAYVADRPGWLLGYCLGNCTKYLHRAGQKPGAAMLEDLKKARWFLTYFITALEQQGEPEHGVGGTRGSAGGGAGTRLADVRADARKPGRRRDGAAVGEVERG